ncbi:hypothetical protein Pelo_19711 [Pelomyxa schiedti]|nr:hypothetical protein Pelo_19711 [Pelomyxa schiedti]
MYNLGKQGGFLGKKLLVFGIAGNAGPWNTEAIEREVGAPGLGFKIEYSQSEQDFINRLPQFDMAWVISSSNFFNASVAPGIFAEACRNFHKQGKGLLIFGDNAPLYFHANVVLPCILGEPMQLVGDQMCDQVLKAGKNTNRGEFGMHLIVSGLQRIYEVIQLRIQCLWHEMVPGKTVE